MKSNHIDPIPDEFENIQAAADFWDSHSLADYWDQTKDAEFDVHFEGSAVLIPIEQKLAERLRAVARQQGLSAETLANLWLREHIEQAA